MTDFFSTSQTATGEEVSALAARIAALMEKHHNSGPAISACLDDMLGAVYSLFYASRHEYADRVGKSLAPPDMVNVIVRAKDMAQGRVRENGKWVAGFYFNNALFRLAAVYHRTLKVLTHKENSELLVGALLPIAKASYLTTKGQVWENRNLHEIHKQVNGLKHTAEGVYRGRNVKFEHAVKGVDELLQLIETIG